MNNCPKIDGYLDQTLSSEQRAQFQAHLQRCHSCRQQLAQWQQWQQQAQQWFKPQPAMDAATRTLLQKASRANRKKPLWRPTLALAGGMAAVVLLAVFWSNRVHPPNSKEARVAKLAILHSQNCNPVDTDHPNGIDLTVAPQGHLLAQLDNHRFGLDAETSVTLKKAYSGNYRLNLRAGNAAFEVAPLHDGGLFAIEVDDILVEVVGTRFLLQRLKPGHLRVSVEKGLVHVTTRSGLQKVAAGHSWESTKTRQSKQIDLGKIKRLLSMMRQLAQQSGPPLPPQIVPQPDAPEAPAKRPSPKKRVGPKPPRKKLPAPQPGPEQWQDLIAGGRYAQAAQTLETHLKQTPQDYTAWSLLADCHRKTRSWQKSLQAYRKVIANAPLHVANRARFLSASIYQDRLAKHAPAEQLLRAYLAQPGGQTLAAEAGLRLGKAQLALGRIEAAATTLGSVIKQHHGTTAAIEARHLLGQIRKDAGL